MSLRRDTAGVSEIVGALMLVVIVSSAAFGFGLFLHKQAQETQEQKAAEQALRLEKVTVPALALPPVDLTDACDGSALVAPADGIWDTLTLRLTSEHLKESVVGALRLNGLTVHRIDLAPFDSSNTLSFDSGDVDYAELRLQPRESLVIQLDHVSCSDASGLSPFYAPSTPIATTEPLQVELVTALGNHVERAFVPPNPIVLLNTQGAAATSYILDASQSMASNENGFLVSWTWAVTCTGESDVQCDDETWTTSGRLAQASLIDSDPADLGTDYAITLTVKDNYGMTGTSSFVFTL